MVLWFPEILIHDYDLPEEHLQPSADVLNPHYTTIDHNDIAVSKHLLELSNVVSGNREEVNICSPTPGFSNFLKSFCPAPDYCMPSPVCGQSQEFLLLEHDISYLGNFEILWAIIGDVQCSIGSDQILSVHIKK